MFYYSFCILCRTVWNALRILLAFVSVIERHFIRILTRLYDLCVFEQHSTDKQRSFAGVLSSEPTIDLMVVDVPEGLHVPTISAPPAPIPRWNEFGDSWLVPVFDFASAYLHDRGALLVMYPSSSSHRGQLLGCCASYGFKVSQTWLGMNRLHLTSSFNPRLTVILLTLTAVNSFEITFAWN